MLLAFIAWLFLGSVARTVTVDGVLIAPGERRSAVSAEPGQLLEYLVTPGNRVKAGQPVARQSVPGLDREQSILRERMELLRAELGRTGGAALRNHLVPARAALLEIEARRASRQTVVSPGAGEVMVLSSVAGTFLEAGDAVAVIRSGDEGPLLAVLGVDRDTARRLGPGMAASVEVLAPDGVTRRLDGTVARLAPGPGPDWLVRLMPWVPSSWDRIEVALRQAPDFPVTDGMACRVRIELDTVPPAALLVPGRS